MDNDRPGCGDGDAVGGMRDRPFAEALSTVSNHYLRRAAAAACRQRRHRDPSHRQKFRCHVVRDVQRRVTYHDGGKQPSPTRAIECRRYVAVSSGDLGGRNSGHEARSDVVRHRNGALRRSSFGWVHCRDLAVTIAIEPKQPDHRFRRKESLLCAKTLRALSHYEITQA